MKRFFTGLLTCTLLLGLLPTAALAVEDAPYLDRHWDEITNQVITEEKYASTLTAVTSSDIAWGTAGTTTWYVVSGSVTIGKNDFRRIQRVTVTGDVRLILTDGSVLTVYGGIHVADNDDDIMNGSANGLTIYGQQNGTGTLTAQVIQQENLQDNGEFAGIGGNKYENGGAITINGGTVNAIGGMWAAGIGGGDAADTGKNGSGGNITINGGTVNAACLISSSIPLYAYGAGAGIGGGSNGAGGNITINGGMVTATGQKWQYGGAGIGGCRSGNGGTITINGGTVIATGGERNGSGIGGGNNGTGGTVTINGGNVTATGIKGAGIGDGGTITINGGIVKATGSTGGINGSFSTGTNGNSFITASSISDNDDKSGWSGIIFQEDAGQVYGNPTLAASVEISSGKTLTIPEDTTLTIGSGATLTNNGKITVENGSTLINNGTIINNDLIEGGGAITNNGTIGGSNEVTCHIHNWSAEWNSDATRHWHNCTEGCPVTENNQKAGYAAHSGGTATCAAQAVCVVCGAPYGEKAPSNHTGGTEVRGAAEATESAEGYTGDTYCLGCGAKISNGTTIPKKGSGSSGGGSSAGGGGSYTPPTYKPDITSPGGGGGGTPSVSPSNPRQGDTVTVTPKPNDGCKVDKITVTDRNGRPVEITQKPDGTYTFQQPSGRVTIEIEYAPIPTTDLPWNNPFTDVSEGDWYYEAVRFVQENGLMNGYSDGRFGPNDNLSRAQLTQILFNKEGRPVVNYLLDFSDIAGEVWYTEAIRWAASQGIVDGYGNGLFGPNDSITREQLAVMLWRYSGSPTATDKELHFNDTDEISPFALEAMRWAVENNILNGYGDGQLVPQGQATRTQTAQMLKNFIENQEENTQRV